MNGPGRLLTVSAPRVPEGKGGLLTISEVAGFLAVTEQTVRNWCARGDMPHGKLGRDLRFDREQLQAWVDSKWSSTGRDAADVDDTADAKPLT